MSQIKRLPVRDLKLDLHNFRTVPQRSELKAVQAMISINPGWFWALVGSLIEDGYHLTENIIVLRQDHQFIVKEGNRRIAALKLILGEIKLPTAELPTDVQAKISQLNQEWETANEEVPCAIYASSEEASVDKIVTLTHGKGEKAGRDAWKAVARARHNRDMNGGSEPGLDLLEKYLRRAKNFTPQQQTRWAGDYPLSVLDELMKKWAPRFGAATAKELADKYPTKISHGNALEAMLLDIGLESLSFNDIRNTAKDVALTDYGLPSIEPAAATSKPNTAAHQDNRRGGPSEDTANVSHSPSTHPTSASTVETLPPQPTAQTPSASPLATRATATTSTARPRKTKAVSTNDPKAVSRTLRRFKPQGNGREKLVALLDEAKTLNIRTHPYAFCFVLRSMFEISAKAYCEDHKADGLSCTKNGQDPKLVDALRKVTKHLTNSSQDTAALKQLHGAMTELAKNDGYLSVTSFNQLVHHPSFSVGESQICTLFGNIFPLLKAMNS